MSKVTSKYQVTVPRAIAEEYNIHPGDEIEWIPAGDGIRVLTPSRSERLPKEERLRLFKEMIERHRKGGDSTKAPLPSSRGWTREELYTRGRSR
jgi:AbrB family looped-hinge helix DNA binding protein